MKQQEQPDENFLRWLCSGPAQRRRGGEGCFRLLCPQRLAQRGVQHRLVVSHNVAGVEQLLALRRRHNHVAAQAQHNRAALFPLLRRRVVRPAQRTQRRQRRHAVFLRHVGLLGHRRQRETRHVREPLRQLEDRAHNVAPPHAHVRATAVFGERAVGAGAAGTPLLREVPRQVDHEGAVAAAAVAGQHGVDGDGVEARADGGRYAEGADEAALDVVRVHAVVVEADAHDLVAHEQRKDARELQRRLPRVVAAHLTHGEACGVVAVDDASRRRAAPRVLRVHGTLRVAGERLEAVVADVQRAHARRPQPRVDHLLRGEG
eukprot:Rhum_TRINITY_DN2411_c0_g1::Rhum_TRINITY_DN2411_c0_g1_i1::g.7136::m.7136